MPRHNSLETRLPPRLYGEVYALAMQGRHTINDLVFMVQERGYVISKSAMHRFIQRVQGPEGVVRRWLAGHPKSIPALADLLEANPAIDFGKVHLAHGGGDE